MVWQSRVSCITSCSQKNKIYCVAGTLSSPTQLGTAVSTMLFVLFAAAQATVSVQTCKPGDPMQAWNLTSGGRISTMVRTVLTRTSLKRGSLKRSWFYPDIPVFIVAPCNSKGCLHFLKHQLICLRTCINPPGPSGGLLNSHVKPDKRGGVAGC